MGTVTSEQIAIPNPVAERAHARIKLYEELEGGQGREIFFRPQRYTPEQFTPLNVWAEITLSGVQYRCELRDLSQGGLGIIWPRPTLPDIDALIEEITVCFDHQYAYVGSASVSVLRIEEEGQLVGLDLRDSLIKIDALLQTRDLKRFHFKGDTPFGGQFQPWQVEGHHEFKGRTGELKLFLEDWENHFNRVEEQASWDLLRFDEDHPTRQALTELVHRDFMAPFLEQTERIYESIRSLSRAEQEPLKAFSQRYLDEYFMKAPWMHRARTKPLGYPGDYEVMNHIYARRMQGRNLIGQAINYATLHSPAARAVRNRKEMLKFEMKRMYERLCAETTETPIKILSVAAGPAQETFELLSELKMINRPIDIVLFDQDAAALAFAYGRLKRLVDERWPDKVRLVYLHDSIRRLLEDADLFSGFGPFDAVICSGLYDYLRHSTAVKLTSHMHDYCKPNGSVYIGNMVPSNPSRWIMEQHLDWYLTYREHDEILQFTEEACPHSRHEILTEPAGVNPFVRITRLD
jgi:hypothetical protein